MKRSLLLILIVPLLTNACATGGIRGSRDAVSDSSSWRGDPRLYRILLPYPMLAPQHDSLAAYAAANAPAMDALLADAAADTAAPSSVRVNAMHALAQRGADRYMRVFRDALLDDDVRIRASAVAAMRELIRTHTREAVSIGRMALADSAPLVQAQALQIVGDSDVELLRDYAERTPHAELRIVAQDLVRLAEQRGARLIADSIGVIRRETGSGWMVTFRPDRRWPEWDAGYGKVTLERDGASTHVLNGIEVVAGVIPAFVSPDGRYVVYERDRTIVVRSLVDGSERIVGPGIAPRLRPFTDEFIFAVQRSAGEEREKTRITYGVYTAPFEQHSETAPVSIGTLEATISFGERGGFSPVRWMRVEERTGYFYLNGEHMDPVVLPDPFGQM